MEQTTQFLAKRDGIDKTLKIMRYSIRLVLTLMPPSTLQVREAHGGQNASKTSAVCDTDSYSKGPSIEQQLKLLETSIGTSRKAYRLGKFLQNVNAVRKMPVRAPHATLEIIANIGEGLYYFVDQFQWLVKIGVLPSRLGKRLTRISASGELIGYVASIILTVLRLHNLLEREVALIAEVQRRRRNQALKTTYATLYGGTDVNSLDRTLTEDEKDDALVAEIRGLRSRRALRTLALGQDLADMFLAIADLRQTGDREAQGILSNRTFLATAGLISGCISAYKNWPGVMK